MAKEAREIVAYHEALAARAGNAEAVGSLKSLGAQIEHARIMGWLSDQKPEDASLAPTTEQEQALEQAVKELKASPTSPELWTRYWQTKLALDGQGVGLQLTLPDCDRTAEETTELIQNGRMLVYKSEVLDLIILGRMYPGMQSWALQEGKTVVSEERSGWLDIEASLNSPNLGTKEKQAQDIFKTEGLFGQTLPTYILGSQASHNLKGYYFDERTSSRLPGSRASGRVVYASFNSDGRLYVYSHLLPQHTSPGLGARSEGVKSA